MIHQRKHLALPMERIQDVGRRKVSVDLWSGCWLWTGRRSGRKRCPYGEIEVRGIKYAAHRVFYESYRERIPDELQLDHLCRATRCVNPWHLEAVTARENVRRGHAWWRLKRMGRDTCPLGHPYDGIEKQEYKGPGRVARVCKRCRLAKHRRTYQRKVARAKALAQSEI